MTCVVKAKYKFAFKFDENEKEKVQYTLRFTPSDSIGRFPNVGSWTSTNGNNFPHAFETRAFSWLRAIRDIALAVPINDWIH